MITRIRLGYSTEGPGSQDSPDSKPQRVTDHLATSWPAGRMLVEETPEG